MTEIQLPEVSPMGQLTPTDNKRNLRDGIMVIIGTGLIQILELLKVADFGEWTIVVSGLCAIAIIVLNRLFNVYRM